jgi:hypothetical protein
LVVEAGCSLAAIKLSLDFNCSSLGCPGALSKINNVLDGKFCFLRNVFTGGSKLSWNPSVNTSRLTQPWLWLLYITGRLWFLNALGFTPYQLPAFQVWGRHLHLNKA